MATKPPTRTWNNSTKNTSFHKTPAARAARHLRFDQGLTRTGWFTPGFFHHLLVVKMECPGITIIHIWGWTVGYCGKKKQNLGTFWNIAASPSARARTLAEFLMYISPSSGKSKMHQQHLQQRPTWLHPRDPWTSTWRFCFWHHFSSPWPEGGMTDDWLGTLGFIWALDR